MRKVYFLAIFAIAFISCKNEAKKDDENQSETIAEVEKVPGIVLENMDANISPKEDFYNYVNGSWMKNTEIPEDRTRWGGFGVLRKKTDYDVLEILAKAKSSGKYAAGTDQYKALLIYESIMDTVSRDKAGVTPLQSTLDKIAGIKNLSDLQTVLATETAASAPFAGLVSFPNLSNSEINAPYISTGGLGLPDRDYYLDQDEKSVEIRGQYVDHITRMLQYIGETEKQARKNAETILSIETKLAEPRLDKVESRDTRNFNNPRSIEQLTEMTSAIDWNRLMKDLGVTKQLDSVIVMQPKYMKELQNVLTSSSIEDLKTVMRWSTLNQASGSLSTEIEKANWDFYSKTLNGALKQRPMEERALARVNGSVGEAIGQLYVDAKFPPEAKAKAEKMIANVIKAYQKRIEVLDWMSDSTKTKAIQKLDKFTVKIGYPDEWEDYSTLDVKDGNSYFENMMAVAEWGFKKNISEIGEPVDKTEWGMSPQTVNAYFNPLFNEIVFPAAILQPPFYNYTADEAVNYGGIGAVIGHEISHAFDDSGARFDANGNLSNWWTEDDLKQFTERGGALAEQYSAIEVLDSVFINGKFTLGENIGDLGGVLGAYDGLQMHFAENGRPDDIDGFTAEQRFFMSWATVWRTKIREDALRTQIKTDPHSPGTTRAIQPLLNVQAFYDAFDIKEGDKMYLAPEKRVSIW
ncbi:M13 family metallopeptidase [Aquimarina sp. 2201CG14-23]|uniref:M13 family metallopeptidase n=1 Tax=Aquimarina mycalae TaxID=3040073 RepID=UPI002477EAE2|nr:M13 family metallopeptidase [Aquimarina sp. 2201CG14-23]MDH7444159.1 M13 family metallopeptidase [Aquimarina sp. 2201CG14-23]